MILAGCLVAALAAICTGCGVELGEVTEWQAIADIEGAMAPSQGASPDPSEKRAPTDRPLRIVTYNIKDGGVEPDVLARAILADPDLAAADVVLLQEAIALPDKTVERVEELARLLGMSWVFAPAREQFGYILGDAILSRYPLDNLAVMRLPMASGKNRRIALAADLTVGDVTVRIINTHLDTTLNITDRVLQLRPAVIDLPPTALVGGDFNTNPYAWSEGTVPIVPASQIVDTDQAPQLDSYMAAIGFANPTAHLGDTNVRYGITSRLDAVFARDVAITGTGIQRGIDLSDHWPLWLDVDVH